MTRWTLILAAALVVGAPSVAATTSFVVRGDTQIGAFKTRGGVVADAKKAFGTPSTVRKKNASQCTAVWRDLGLVISFPASSGGIPAKGAFSSWER